MIQLKRIYDKKTDNTIRILVDRLWPRGISKKDADIDEWLKEIAPSHKLRKWYSHDKSKWDEFKVHYKKELSTNEELLKRILEYENKNDVTLLFASKDQDHNNAVVLKEYIEEQRNE